MSPLRHEVSHSVLLTGKNIAACLLFSYACNDWFEIVLKIILAGFIIPSFPIP